MRNVVAMVPVLHHVGPAQAGTHTESPKMAALMSSFTSAWIPGFAGMTV
jgi:hypothetical protein